MKFTLWLSKKMSEYFDEEPTKIDVKGVTIEYNIAFNDGTDHSLAWPDSIIVATEVELPL